MNWRDEDQRNRVTSAINTLCVMITYKKWEEALAIVDHELDWNDDPKPELGSYQGLDGWALVYYGLLMAKQDAAKRH
jgi:hypothetical protein